MTYETLFEQVAKDAPLALPRTTRRVNAEAVIDLRKRRTWRVDDKNPGGSGGAEGDKKGGDDKSGGKGGEGGGDSGGDDDDADESGDWFSKLPADAQREIREARKEAKNLRKRLRDREAADADAETKRKKAEQDALAESGKFKELWDGAQTQLERLKELEAAEAARGEKLKASNKARIDKLPEDKRSLVPQDYDADKLAVWLDENEPKLSKAVPPNLNPGKQGTTSTNPTKPVLRKVNY